MDYARRDRRHHGGFASSLTERSASSRGLFRQARPRSTYREPLEGFVITLYESLFLRPSPLLQLSFIFHSIGDAVKPLRVHQRYRPPSRGIAAKSPGIVLSNSDFQGRAGCADLEASIRASKNIKKGAFSHFFRLIRNSTPRPEERREATRLEGRGHRRGLMVRDGARAPPHHEE